MLKWSVVPICAAQKLDVAPEDLLQGGLYRLCNVAKAGGGYDKFPEIAAKRLGGKATDYTKHFVVQLRGCVLNCWYCYVTPQGVWGEPEMVSTKDMVAAFRQSEAQVFHLMGGAPSLYLEYWPELLDELGKAVFHSDFLLAEPPYNLEVLKKIARPNCLYAVNFKGVTSASWEADTNKKLDWYRVLRNLEAIIASGINFYLTFTRPDLTEYQGFKDRLGAQFGDWVLEDSYAIEIHSYKALGKDPISRTL